MVTLVSLANSTLRNTAKSINQLIIIIVILSNLKGDITNNWTRTFALLTCTRSKRLDIRLGA